MNFQKRVDITQVLLFKDEKRSETAGRALWAAFEEIRGFFTHGLVDGWLDVPLKPGSSVARLRPAFTSHYLGAPPPAGLTPPPQPSVLSPEAAERLWAAAAGAPRAQVYSHHAIGDKVREAVGVEGMILVVTDQEIASPPDHRYIIWDVFLSGAVVSLAPVDPAYWGSWDVMHPDPLRAIKWRARAACLSIVGSVLGLNRCDNERCYLFAEVDSVTRLDAMDLIGEEHELGPLTNHGFPDRQADPEQVAEVMRVDAQA